MAFVTTTKKTAGKLETT